MSAPPALKRLLIFRDSHLPFSDLDFSDTATGAALPGFCLIGPNGIGKTTVLTYVYSLLSGHPCPESSEDRTGILLSKFGSAEGDFYFLRSASSHEGLFLQTEIEKAEFWNKRADPSLDIDRFSSALSKYTLPSSSLSPSLREHCLWLGESCDFGGSRQTEDFPTFLSSLTRRREECFHRFLRDPQNRDKTVAEVELAFEAESPEALPQLREMWQRLLASTGIRVDFGSPQGPFLTSAGGAALPRIGEAMQRILLRSAFVLGHFQRSMRTNVMSPELFCDSPELALHPALIMDYLTFLREPIREPGTQPLRLFLATHSPELAFTFPPEQRLRLEIDPTGSLVVLRSEARDFSQILHQDFGIENSIVTARSSRDSTLVSHRTHRLKRAIRESETEDELANLIDEMISFGPHGSRHLS